MTQETTRRGVIAALGTTGALALAFPAVGAAAAPQRVMPSTPEWDAAFAHFQKVDQAHTILWDRWEQADEAAGDEAPERVPHYFNDYKLGIGMKRSDVEYWLRSYVTRTGNRIDIARTADEFDAYQAATLAAHDRHQVDRLYKEASAHNPAYQAARDALMKVPAPNLAALLLKIEIATTSLDDEHGTATLADARRLLSGEA